MNWFRRKDKKIKEKEKKSIPDGLWDKCKSCNEIIYLPELEKNLFICHHCDHHFRVKPSFYKDLLLDNGTAKQYFERLSSVDFLKFKTDKSYEDQLLQAKEKTGNSDAITVYLGEMNQISVVLGVMNFHFIGGSMGSVIGEIFQDL